MILVDTSVWIDFLEGNDHWTKERLKKKINERVSVTYIDLILLEILQGIRSEKDRRKIERYFSNFVLLNQTRISILLAAKIYQELQRKGIKIRSLIDCLIAAISIETGARILHKDRDFDHIEKYFPITTEKYKSQQDG
ncbi:MAG: PIN domain nuclease [Opitutales bacterium]|nr:PIN domain nuclease [Opitutales bacterium]